MNRWLMVLAAGLFAGAASADDSLATQAKRILDAHCHRCHGQGGAVEGGFNYVLDFDKLLARKKVVPGHAADSPLLKRIVNGSMPPVGEKSRPADAEVDVLRKWVDAGAPTEATTTARKPILAADVTRLVLADLDTFDRRGRRFQRYFSLAPQYNAGLGDDELQTYRNALAKLLNSLSWHPKIHNPESVDPAGTILRIDLRWYVWDAALWNRVLNDYPYGVLDDTAAARVAMADTLTKMPVLRADWFVANASRAPLYYDLLQLPGNLPELEKQLRVDAAEDIRQERVARVGFNGSGIARNNRVLERRDAVHGAYWRTYDFDEPPQNVNERGTVQPPDRRNVFAFPLGPGQVDSSFQHAAGEAIFALPNGLHGYVIVNGANERIDKANTAIVSDPKRPDRSVEAGVSCMSCHVTGILPKADQVRDHVDKNPKAFTRTDADLIRALYPPKEKTLAAMEADGKAYAEAVAKTGAKVSRYEAVSTVTLKFEADLDLTAAAGEAGLSPDELRKRIDASEVLKKNVGALRVPGGTVGRAVWQQGLGDSVRELRLGTLFQANAVGGGRADNTGENDPLETLGGAANAAAFLADGKRAVVASSDRGLRVWDVEGKRDVRRLVGHTASVWAVGLSADGSKAISGSADGTARVWDVATGQELAKLDGHAALVAAVALNATGTRALTGGFDGSVVWWDTASGKELRRLDGEAKRVYAVALHPTKKLAAVAADRMVLLWDYTTGEVVTKWDAHESAVTAVTFAEEGKVLLTGGDDGRVKAWDAATGKELLSLTGHDGGVRSVTMRPGGRWLLSASADGSVKLWDAEAKKDVATFRKHSVSPTAAAFLPSGMKTLSVDRDLGTLIWDVTKFVDGGSAGTPLVGDVPDTIPKAK